MKTYLRYFKGDTALRSFVIFMLTMVVALAVAIPTYWTILFSLDMTIGTRQLYAWAQFESRHLLLRQLLNDSVYLALALAPAMALFIATSQIRRHRLNIALTLTVTALAFMTLVAISFSTIQAGLYVASGVISSVAAIFFRHQIFKTYRG